MTEHHDLDRALTDLSSRIDYPPTPDLALRVSAALEQPASRPRWRPLRHGLLAATVALLLVVGGALAVGLGLRGLGIVFVETPRPAGDELRLGGRLSLAEADARVPYRVVLPATLGEPDEVYLDVASGTEQVTLLYGSDGQVDLLLTQFVARPHTEVAVKEITPGTSVEQVSVAGEPGLWIAGDPHVLLYRDQAGRVIEDRVRLVGDVLVWQRGELTLRLEGVTPLSAALVIAASVE
jgi:hypothetical protein